MKDQREEIINLLKKQVIYLEKRIEDQPKHERDTSITEYYLMDQLSFVEDVLREFEIDEYDKSVV